MAEAIRKVSTGYGRYAPKPKNSNSAFAKAQQRILSRTNSYVDEDTREIRQKKKKTSTIPLKGGVATAPILSTQVIKTPLETTNQPARTKGRSNTQTRVMTAAPSRKVQQAKANIKNKASYAGQVIKTSTSKRAFEERIKRTMKREQNLQKFSDNAYKRIGIDRKETDSYIVGVGKVVAQLPFEIAKLPVLYGGRAVVAGEAAVRGQFKDFPSVKEYGKALKSGYDPRKPEGLVNIGLTILGLKAAGKVAKAKVTNTKTARVNNKVKVQIARNNKQQRVTPALSRKVREQAKSPNYKSVVRLAKKKDMFAYLKPKKKQPNMIVKDKYGRDASIFFKVKRGKSGGKFETKVVTADGRATTISTKNMPPLMRKYYAERAAKLARKKPDVKTRFRVKPDKPTGASKKLITKKQPTQKAPLKVKKGRVKQPQNKIKNTPKIKVKGNTKIIPITNTKIRPRQINNTSIVPKTGKAAKNKPDQFSKSNFKKKSDQKPKEDGQTKIKDDTKPPQPPPPRPPSRRIAPKKPKKTKKTTTKKPKKTPNKLRAPLVGMPKKIPEWFSGGYVTFGTSNKQKTRFSKTIEAPIIPLTAKQRSGTFTGAERRG
jgi:hypothetical protein